MRDRFQKQVARAINGSSQQELTLQSDPQSKTLKQTIRVVASLIDRNILLTRIIEEAVWQLRAKGGGIYQYYPEDEELTLVADYGRLDHIRGTLKLGEGLAGRLVQSKKEFRIINNYNRWPGRATVYAGKRLFGAVLEVVLKLNERIVGVLYVDDDANRKFTDRDAHRLSGLASDAAIILSSPEFDEKDTKNYPLKQRLSIRDRLWRWERLSQISNEIVSDLSTMGLKQRLNLIARRTAEIMRAESCGICLVKRKGFLSWEASYRHKGNVFREGREFKIISAPKAGLTSHIAKEGKLFNTWGRKLTGHWAVKNDRRDRSVYKNCYSLLALPLKKGDDLIGLLRVENKLGDDGKPHRELHFTQEDEWILNSFGQAVVVAVEEARLVEGLERLVTSSPNGIIATDREGNITTFNEQAENILKYKKEEVIKTPVSKLYFDPKEARRIGGLLHSKKKGKLEVYKTSVKTKDGREIPIRLSASWLYDPNKKPVGSVGYFEDLRHIQQKDRYLDLLLKSGNLVAQAKTLDEGLQYLAKEVVLALTSTFCRILLLDETGELLVPKAASLISLSGDNLRWKAGLNKSTPIKNWPGLAKILEGGDPQVLSIKEKKYRQNLIKLSKRLNLKKNIESLLMVPLKIDDWLVGLLHVGELRREESASFSIEKINLASAVAEQTAALIQRTRLFETTDRDRQLLRALDEASGYMRAEKEPAKLLQESVRLAAEMIGCKAGGFYINNRHLKQLELKVTYGISDKLEGNTLSHSQGLAGLVARTGETRVIYKYSRWADREVILDQYGFKVLIGVPLKQDGEVEAVLFIADTGGKRQFTKADLDILEKFVVRSSVALHTSELLSNERRMSDRLRIVHDISDYIQSEGNLDNIPHAVLTGVTAGYGLGFNRAVMFLLDEKGEYLIGKEAIGQFTDRDVRKAWDRDNKLGLSNFAEYLRHLKRGAILKTPLGKQICKLRFPVQPEGKDAFSRAVLTRSHILVEERFNEFPIEFANLFAPTSPVIIIPLLARDKMIGLLAADNKFTQSPITSRDIESLSTLASTVATSIVNISLLEETKSGREKLRSLYIASSKLISLRKPHQVLKDIVARMRAAAEASWVSLVLIDEDGQVSVPVTAGLQQQTDATRLIRPDGISMEVMRTGEPVPIENTLTEQRSLNPSMFKMDKVAAALCLPLSLHSARIGVVWIHYAEPHHFLNSEIEALQLYVNQAALAYDSARRVEEFTMRVEELKQMRRAAEALAKVTEPQEVTSQIVRSAREVLQADSAVFWYYDNTRGKFIIENSKADGIADRLWEMFRRNGPRPDGTAYKIFTEGLIQVKDVRNSEESNHLGENARKMLGRIGARRFLGVALSADKDKLGVLYVNYGRPRSFSEQEQETVRAFANYAALALKRARLLGHVNKARDTAKLVAEVTTLENEDLDSTLKSIVEGTQSVLDCDIVTLYVYSPDRRRLSHAPVMTGVKYPRRTRRLREVHKDSIVFKTLRRKQMLVARDTSTHPLFKDSRFSKDEKIVSCVAIPLKARGEKVGVMFVNYLAHHRFTHEEITNIELLADQAAVAIRNAQLYERQQRRAEALQALYEAGQAVTGSLNETEILNRFAEQVWLLTSHKGDKKCFVDVKLVEGMKMKMVVAYPDEAISGKRARLKVGVDLSKGIGKGKRIGIIGRAIKTKRTQIVGDVTKDKDHIRFMPQIRSEIVVPILIKNEVVGVINVEHTDYQAFDKEDRRTLESLASQASIAIQNARQYAKLQQTMGKLGARTALAFMGMASSTWGHSVRNRATVITELVDLLCKDLTPTLSAKKLESRLNEIKRMAKMIQGTPMMAPLSIEAGVESFPIYDFIEARMKQLQGWERYESLSYKFDPRSAKNVSTRANSVWLKLAFDMLLDNAVEAMSNSPKKELRIGVYIKNGGIEIRIIDTGKGIPPEILPKLLNDPIMKPKGAKGLGIGLLQAQAIVQAYGGDIQVGPTSPKGTTMIIKLPLEVKKAKGERHA
jgi:PAS domain S-box-containing protein